MLDHVSRWVQFRAEAWPINIPLTDELKDFLQKKVASGAFPSEEAVRHEAVRRFWQEEQAGCRADSAQKPRLEDLIDYEAIDYCAREVEGKDVPSIENVRRMLSKIPGSMAQAVIEERED
jgi:Arc/MetJ-type ribon-helix-helix transcriptional regulator